MVPDYPSLLKAFNLWPRFRREQVVEQAIASIPCTPEESAQAMQAFCQQHGISVEHAEIFAAHNGLTVPELNAIASRLCRVEKFKLSRWAAEVDAYFLKRKAALDRVVYSIIRLEDAALARELYFRITEGEQSFAELAATYSKGPEAHTGGVIGPVQIGSAHPGIAQILAASQPGTLWAPQRVAEWFVIIRLEKVLPAELDAALRRQLRNELFEAWIDQELKNA